MPRYRRDVGIGSVLGTLFLVLKVVGWKLALNHQYTAAVNNFYALYYLITGVYVLHLVAAIVANGYFLHSFAKVDSVPPPLLRERAENAGMFWQFLSVTGL